MPQWFLELNSGVRVNLARRLTSVGRSSRCDIVIPDPAVSRRQALLFPRPAGVEFVNVGKQPLAIDGDAVLDTALAGEGAEISIAECPLAIVRRSVGSQQGDPHPRWCLRVDQGPLLSLPDAPFSVGGRNSDDLVIAGWAASTLVLHGVGSGLVVEGAEAVGEPAQLEPPALEPGFARLEPGQSLVHAGVRFELVALDGAGLERSTVPLEDQHWVVRLEGFSSGGMMTLERGGDQASVYLARRRYALMQALLVPLDSLESPESGPGGYQSVDALCRRIWPEDPIKDRTDFNVLLHRVRRDLLRAGIEIAELIERERGSGMVRAPILSTPDVEVRVDTRG